MQTWAYRFISLHIVPHLYYWFAPMRPIKEYAEITALIEPGDFLVSTSKFKLTHILIPGMIDHAAIYVGHGDVVEMIGKGWNKIPLRQFWREATNMAVLRLNPHDEAYAYEMCGRANALKGTEYDIDFTLGVDFLYCSELLYVVDFENRAKFDLSDLKGLGKQYLSPTGVYQAKGCTVIYDTH